MILNAHDRILDAAVRVFEEHGIRGATTRRIADMAEVNEVTLFRHFGTKEKLMKEALRWAATCRLPQMQVTLPTDPQDPEAELVQWSQTQLQLIYGHRLLIRTSMAEFEENPDVTSCGTEMPVRVANELYSYIVRLQERGMALRDYDARAATALLMGALFSDAMSRDITPSRFPYSLEDAAERYVPLFIRAIGVQSSGRNKAQNTAPSTEQRTAPSTEQHAEQKKAKQTAKTGDRTLKGR
jgi:AcrR family transcriptional regulator